MKNKTEKVLWDFYNKIRGLNDSDLNEVQILINRERLDRSRNNKA